MANSIGILSAAFWHRKLYFRWKMGDLGVRSVFHVTEAFSIWNFVNSQICLVLWYHEAAAQMRGVLLSSIFCIWGLCSLQNGRHRRMPLWRRTRGLIQTRYVFFKIFLLAVWQVEGHPFPVRDCEHVLFHQCARQKNGARILINKHVLGMASHRWAKSVLLGENAQQEILMLDEGQRPLT